MEVVKKKPPKTPIGDYGVSTAFTSELRRITDLETKYKTPEDQTGRVERLLEIFATANPSHKPKTFSLDTEEEEDQDTP